MEPTRLAIRRYRPGDEARILETFNVVFRQECGPAFADRDLDYWNWQFRDNPAGHQIFLAVDADGTVAAQYTAVPQVADTAWGPLRFVHIVDSMTHPDYRQGLQRQGLFVTLGRAFTADYREHGNELGYGFPVRTAERIGRRLLQYELLRVVEYLVRPCDEPDPPRPADVHVERVVTLPDTVDELWRRCLPERPCAVRRDARYLQWRYERIPTRRDYELHVARSGDALTGVMVLRPFHELVPDSCGIVELVVDDADADSTRALLARACERARACSRRQVLAMFADGSPQWHALLAAGFSAVPSGQWLERRLTYRITGPYVDPEYLRTQWRYSLGDTDLA